MGPDFEDGLHSLLIVVALFGTLIKMLGKKCFQNYVFSKMKKVIATYQKIMKGCQV